MAAFGGSDEASKKRSIVIMDMPERFINRDILKEHFEQFGSVERMACSVSKKYAVIHFNTQAEAETAAARGAIIRPDAPPLKIIHRAVGIPRLTSTQSKPAAAASALPSPPAGGGRVVTRRKIIRNFGNVSGASPATRSTSSLEPATPSTSSTATAVTTAAPSAFTAAEDSADSSAPAPQGHLRSAVKISRPSPFLRKRPSFGDKTVRPGGISTGSRNPFALPPRSALSLDRRKKSDESLKAKVAEKSEVAASSSNIRKTRRESEPATTATVAESSTGIISERVPQEESATEERQVNFQIVRSEIAPAIPGSSSEKSVPSPSAVVDIDETTEDAVLNEDDDEETVDDAENEETNYDEDQEIEDADADTQDTAEVTTEEEEGEIVEDQEEEPEEEEDAAFESPLKRAEMENKNKSSTSSASVPSSSTSSEGSFSFKLKPSKALPTEASFKLPFASPFASGSAPKPFSSASFGGGNTFGGSITGNIFSGGPGPSSSSKLATSTITRTAQQESSVPSSSDKEKTAPLPQFVSKKETEGPSSEATGPAKLPFTPVFGATSSASTFGSSDFGKKSSTTSSSKMAEPKPKKILPSKVSAPTVTASSSSVLSSANPFLQTITRTITTPSMSQRSISPLPSSSKPVMAAPKAKQPTVPAKGTPNPLLLTFYPDTSEAQELFSKRSTNVEERYRILEARDKLIRARVPKTKVNVEFATKLIGTCPDMCPEKERYMRQFQRQLVSYETLPGPDFVVDHQKAVKVYSRSSADQEEPLPHELRPGPTLDFTMQYLLRYIVPLGDNPDENLSDWYNFLWDRTRSIRKDITQQQITDHTAVSLYEKCTRFHIHCASRLCELDMHSFDPKLNDENLMKCLQSLEHLYDDLRRRQVTCPNEPEFRAYQIMMNLNEGDALYNAQQLPSWILNSQEVQVALKLHHSVFTKNFAAFFKMVKSLPYMTSCILHRYFFQVRSLALRCFIKAHCTLPKYETAMPMSSLQRMLGFGPDQAYSFSYLCETHGIHCDIEDGKVILKRKMFYLPDSPSIYRETYLIDSKLGTTVAEAINGGPLPDIDFANHKPHSSFDENGQLIAGNIIGGTMSDEPVSTVRAFVPPAISSSSNRFQPKPASFTTIAGFQSPFSFGESAFQKQREVTSTKPKRDIEAACQVATTKLIEESIKSDVAQVSQAQLEEARKRQEEFERKQLQQQISIRLSSEYAEQILANHVYNIVHRLATEKLVQLKAAEDLARNAAEILLDEGIMINLNLSAKNELQQAKEFHHRLIATLRRIFQRIRARFALEKWIRFSRTRKLERERQEEKRMEELWNFPAIDSYSLSTKEVYKAFCGSSTAQPSLDKVHLLGESPSNSNIANTSIRPKRKSDGETRDHTSEAPTKLPRLASGTNIIANIKVDHTYQEKLINLWEFPPSNPYARTNREVFVAFCGSNNVVDWPVSPKMNTFGRQTSSQNSSKGHNDDNTFFKIHRPTTVPYSSASKLGEEICSKANESISDLMQNIKKFAIQVQEESKRSVDLEPYLEGIETAEKTCSELGSPTGPGHMEVHDEEDDTDWVDNEQYRPLSGVFLEDDDLLSRIRNFSREVKREKSSWNTDTFLNNIDIEYV